MRAISEKASSKGLPKGVGGGSADWAVDDAQTLVSLLAEDVRARWAAEKVVALPETTPVMLHALALALPRERLEAGRLLDAVLAIDKALLTRKDLTLETLEVIAARKSLPSRVALHPANTAESLSRIPLTGAAVANAVVSNKNASPDLVRDMVAATKFPDAPRELAESICQSIWAAAASRADIGVDLQEWLYRKAVRSAEGHAVGRRISWALAENEALDPGLLEKIVLEAAPAVKALAVANPSLPAEALTRLARSTDPETRTVVARQPRTPPAALIDLARDPNLPVLRAIVHNPACPPAAMAHINQYWRLTDDIAEASRPWLQHNLGIHEQNEGAVDMLAHGEWWTLTPESPEVLLALRAHRNP